MSDGPSDVGAAAAADIDVDRLVRLDGRVAIVTGASSGLGVRFAQVLHAAGAHVVLTARRQERLRDLAAELSNASVVVADVAEGSARERLVAETLAEHGRIDVLVNNAGIGTPMPAEEEPVDHFQRVMDVNVTAMFALTQLVGRHMIGRAAADADDVGGSIVNIASILGLVASAPIKQASYAASKGAVVNLTRELAVQWARKRVRVNAIAPGWFPSEMTTEMFTDPASMAYLERNAPMGRSGRLDELDGALLFLAGDASSYFTGQILTVDGGWTAR
jgi:NAD(P)-dependent dehydrogenase (short-subunit alcohol dehydrogenase family)